jgi:protein-S-isoprenylcysteine O-methyltransferase Ste14
MSRPRKFWMRWRVRLGYPVAAIYWVLARPTARSIAIAGIIAAIGLLIRGSSSGHLRKDRELAVSGPYAYTRNPLYLGSSFLALGFAMGGLSWWGGLLVAAYFGIFYYAVMRNEEADLGERFGAAYRDYAARVPLFFPKFAAATTVGPSQLSTATRTRKFSWKQYRRNREYKALIGTVAGLGVLWLRMWIRGRWGY